MYSLISGINDNFTAIIDSPVGKIGFKTNDSQLTYLKFLDNDLPFLAPTSTFAKQVIAELNSYFNNPKHIFSIGVSLQGTPYQQKVWQALQTIPSSKTKTYGELARSLVTGARAIGNACRNNPVAIVVPCHRIVATNHIGGFAGNINGKFKEIKQWLLHHEQTK